MSGHTKGAVHYERCSQLDRRISRGDDFAGDAYVRWVAVGHVPNDERDRAELLEVLILILIAEFGNRFAKFPRTGTYWDKAIDAYVRATGKD
jgi:hypothetical protein